MSNKKSKKSKKPLNETNTDVNIKKEENHSESKEEKVVFKNDEKQKEEKKEKALSVEPTKEIKKVEIAKNEILENNVNSKRKVGAIAIVLIVILVIALIFSTSFAMIYSTKNTIAKGVKINHIDLSGLTYNEAKEKLNEAFKTVLDVEIDLSHEDYHYKIKAEDIELSYDFQKELEEACNIGRKRNIIECNYVLLMTAIKGKEFTINYIVHLPRNVRRSKHRHFRLSSTRLFNYDVNKSRGIRPN